MCLCLFLSAKKNCVILVENVFAESLVNQESLEETEIGGTNLGGAPTDYPFSSLIVVEIPGNGAKLHVSYTAVKAIAAHIAG